MSWDLQIQTANIDSKTVMVGEMGKGKGNLRREKTEQRLSCRVACVAENWKRTPRRPSVGISWEGLEGPEGIV